MFKVTDTGKKAKASRKGRNSKNKGASYERKLAKLFQKVFGIEFVRTPLSGGFLKNNTSAIGFKGDIVPANRNVDFLFHIEAKNSKTWSFPKWITQAEQDAPKGKIPLVIAHKFNISRSYVLIDLEHFLDLIPANKVINLESLDDIIGDDI